MMKRFILALVCLLAPLGVRAQVQVSGNVKDAGTSNITSASTFVRFTLTGFGNNIPKVNGTNIVGRPYTDFHPDANGNIAGPLQGNDTITPNGTLYQVCIFDAGTQFKCNSYSITGNIFNLNTATPVITGPGTSVGFITTPKVIEFVQGPAATTWTIVHNFGDKNVIFDCYDTNNKFLIPDTVTQTSITTLTITFTSAQAGSCTVMTAQSVSLSNAPADAVLKNSQSAQVITTSPITIQTDFAATGPSSMTNLNTVYFASGMKCDGSTDDSAALTAAIALATPGTKVSLPTGTCVVHPGISVPDSIWLQGATKDATTLLVAAGANSTSPLFNLSGTGKVLISDMTLDGNKANQSSGGALIGTTASSLTGTHIERMRFQNAYTCSIMLWPTTTVTGFDISDNDFLNNSTATTQGQDQSGAYGDICVRAPIGGKIHDNKSVNSLSNFVAMGTNALTGIGNVMVSHNVVANALGFGVLLGGGGGSAANATIDGNNLSMVNSRENSIDLALWTSTVTSNNIITSGNCTLCAGIGDGPPANNAVISNNIVFANPLGGGDNCIAVGGNDDVISGNWCTNSGGSGIVLTIAAADHVTGGQIINNVVKDSNQVKQSAPGRPGIDIFLNSGASIFGLIIKGNHCYDDQATQTQTYGIGIGTYTASGDLASYHNITIEGNDLRGNLTDGILNNAANPLTNGISIHGNPGMDPLPDAPVNLTAQSANVTSQGLYFVRATQSGPFLVSVYELETQAATASSTLPTVVVQWLDADSGVLQTANLVPTSASGNSTTTMYQGSVFVNPEPGEGIIFATSGYASSGATPMKYSLHMRLQSVQ
jgi:hypothetical protein